MFSIEAKGCLSSSASLLTACFRAPRVSVTVSEYSIRPPSLRCPLSPTIFKKKNIKFPHLIKSNSSTPKSRVNLRVWWKKNATNCLDLVQRRKRRVSQQIIGIMIFRKFRERIGEWGTKSDVVFLEKKKWKSRKNDSAPVVSLWLVDRRKRIGKMYVAEPEFSTRPQELSREESSGDNREECDEENDTVTLNIVPPRFWYFLSIFLENSRILKRKFYRVNFFTNYLSSLTD